MVESWRRVAQAAVLGEHDFPGLMDHGRLSGAQCVTVLKDAAEVTRALIVLDKRYNRIPGWIPIRERGRLDQAAQACAVFAGYDDPDYSVDVKGWRPPSATIDGGPLPGIGGVLQAEHNMLVHLAQFPNALNLRRVLDGQRMLSHEAARRTLNVAPELADKWLKREQTYGRLIHESRNVGGLVGSGGLAAAEAASAVRRLRHVQVDEMTSPEPLRDLDKLFTRTDARVAAIIEQGLAERLYFVSVKVPRIVDGTGQLVSPARVRYVPITAPVQTGLMGMVRDQLRPTPVPPMRPVWTGLMGMVRDQLRPTPVPPTWPAGAHESRAGFRGTLEHRPDRRTGPSR